MAQDEGNHFLLRFRVETSMDVHFVFDVRERAIKRIRRVWDVELGIFLVGKKMRQPVLRRAVCRANIAVRVLPSAGLYGDGFLGEKCLVLLVPCRECVSE